MIVEEGSDMRSLSPFFSFSYKQKTAWKPGSGMGGHGKRGPAYPQAGLRIGKLSQNHCLLSPQASTLRFRCPSTSSSSSASSEGRRTKARWDGGSQLGTSSALRPYVANLFGLEGPSKLKWASPFNYCLNL